MIGVSWGGIFPLFIYAFRTWRFNPKYGEAKRFMRECDTSSSHWVGGCDHTGRVEIWGGATHMVHAGYIFTTAVRSEQNSRLASGKKTYI